MNLQPRKPYAGDLTDDQWAVLRPLLPPPVPAGAPRKTDLREVLNAIFYLLANGLQMARAAPRLPARGDGPR